ncbi:hypothetical protein GCM10027167_11160 [Nocardia heshunensis]
MLTRCSCLENRSQDPKPASDAAPDGLEERYVRDRLGRPALGSAMSLELVTIIGCATSVLVVLAKAIRDVVIVLVMKKLLIDCTPDQRVRVCNRLAGVLLNSHRREPIPNLESPSEPTLPDSR